MANSTARFDVVFVFLLTFMQSVQGYYCYGDDNCGLYSLWYTWVVVAIVLTCCCGAGGSYYRRRRMQRQQAGQVTTATVVAPPNGVQGYDGPASVYYVMPPTGMPATGMPATGMPVTAMTSAPPYPIGMPVPPPGSYMVTSPPPTMSAPPPYQTEYSYKGSHEASAPPPSYASTAATVDAPNVTASTAPMSPD